MSDSRKGGDKGGGQAKVTDLYCRYPVRLIRLTSVPARSRAEEEDDPKILLFLLSELYNSQSRSEEEEMP